ncbi:MAG: hypothetical protein E5V52_04410 [Mesorhizobium sp.]|nr:MAG: hypothetical protein E5V52_04410 [Mesorhizobium sp.]
MKLSALPAKFPVAWGASASPSYIRSIPLGSQIGIVNGAASLTDGFPPLNFLPERHSAADHAMVAVAECRRSRPL